MKNKKGGLSDMVNTRVNNIARYCSVKESLEDSLKELKLYKENKIKLQTWEEYIKSKNK